tara:strand:- start:2056 stop:2262 length:207 start_codon:yes stop_codon:yes gene_type:complete
LFALSVPTIHKPIKPRFQRRQKIDKRQIAPARFKKPPITMRDRTNMVRRNYPSKLVKFFILTDKILLV